jgi:hypothetical protein
MGRIYVLLFFAGLILAVISLISCLSAEEGDVRALPRWAWVVIILFFRLGGSFAYRAAGRPQLAGAGPGAWRPGAGFPEAERPRRPAPDDDPEFLRQLDAKSRRDDEDLLRRWEEDLKRREDDLKRGKPGDDSPPDG